MDTAFCRIYHVECRGWVEQKRFALVMLLVVAIFLAASIVIPIAEGRRPGAGDLPFGLDSVGAWAALVVLGAALTITFAILCTDLLGRPQGPHAVARRLAGGAVRDDRDRHRATPSSRST